MNASHLDPDEESRRLARLLRQLLKLDHRSVRSVEQNLGLGSSALGKVLNGNIRLQVSHVFMILNVLEMTPAQFFYTAYPQKPPMHRLTEELRGAHGMGAAVEDEPNDPALEAKVKRILLQLLGGLLSAEGGAEPVAGSEPPAAKRH
jgi:transcriptional regulator with XRE-family HTH domain